MSKESIERKDSRLQSFRGQDFAAAIASAADAAGGFGGGAFGGGGGGGGFGSGSGGTRRNSEASLQNSEASGSMRRKGSEDSLVEAAIEGAELRRAFSMPHLSAGSLLDDGRDKDKTTRETGNVMREVDESGNKFVNQYMMVMTLGRGSFGKVKLCVNRHNGRPYALKLIQKERLKNVHSGSGTALQVTGCHCHPSTSTNTSSTSPPPPPSAAARVDRDCNHEEDGSSECRPPSRSDGRS